MPHSGFDLAAAARQVMIDEGFDPDFPPGVEPELSALAARPAPSPDGPAKDLRSLLWSSIDNDSSRDLDQVEVAERVDGGIHVLVGIADVDIDVPAGSAIDRHASSQTTSVYTGVRTFPMLPEALSTDLTSLNQDVDRYAIAIDFVVAADGSISSSSVHRALVRNRAQLTYSATGAWLEGNGPAPAKVASSAELQSQVNLQDEAARLLRAERHRLGALDFDRIEAQPIIVDGEVRGIAGRPRDRASKLIESFMVAAHRRTGGGLRGDAAPEPDAVALSTFLQKRKAADSLHYADLSLAVIKLMGPGEYALLRPAGPAEGHFALAAHDYTHSTAPNRRFADLVTQRLIKSVLDRKQAPYSDEELSSIAGNCTLKEDAARKVERKMNKRIAAVAVQPRIGETFTAVVTGVTPKGVFVRVLDPPVEGRLMRGESGVDVGDRLQVTLLRADPQLGFIDFGVN